MAIYKGAAFCAQENRYFSVTPVGNTVNPVTPADATTWDYSPVQTLDLVYNTGTSGALPPGAPDSVTITLYEGDSQTVLASQTLAAPVNGAVVTLTLNSVCADYRLYLQASAGGIGSYDVNSDLQNTSGILRFNPTSITFQQWHTGTSNPASYNDNIEVHADLSEGFAYELSYRHFTVEAANATDGTVYATTTTDGTDPQNALIKVDNKFPASEVSVNIDISVIALPSAIAPDSEPDATWITIPEGTTDRVDSRRVRKGPFPVDAAIYAVHHMQLNDATYSASLLVTSRLNSDLGLITVKMANARGEALSGITYQSYIQDQDQLVGRAFDRTLTTQADGFPPTMTAWDSQLPSGAWIHTITITGPADAVGLDWDTTMELTLLAQSPNYGIICGAGPSTIGAAGDHWTPGEDFLVGAAMYDKSKATLMDPDLSPGPSVLIGRFRPDLGIVEYLDANYDWLTLGSGAAYEHILTQSPSDSRVWILTISGAETAAWTNPVLDLFVVGQMNHSGTPYWSFTSAPVVGGKNKHSRHEIDPLAIALGGIISNR